MALVSNRTRCLGNRLLPARNASRDGSFSNISNVDGFTNGAVNLCRNSTGRRLSAQNAACNLCKTACIYKCVELVYVVGIVANLLVVSRVILDRKLRKPTYVAIACLALSDALFLTINIFQAAETVIRSTTCPATNKESYTFQSAPGNIISGITWFSSNLHITLLAVLRYLMIVYPLKSNVYIKNTRIIIVSVCIWILSTTVYVLRYVIGRVTGEKPARSAEITAVIWLCGYLLPLVITSVLHIVKLKQLRKYSKATDHLQTVYIKVSIQRMSKVIIVVIALAATLPLPRFIFLLLQRLKYEYPSDTVLLHFRNISSLLYLLNNVLNPFIYAFMSLPFRNSLRSMCASLVSMCKMQRYHGNSANGLVMSTPKSSRKTDISAIADSPEVKRHATQL